MRRFLGCSRIFVFCGLSWCIAGCGVAKSNYRLNPPLLGAEPLPVSLAVLPFQDKTGDFIFDRPNPLVNTFEINMAKHGNSWAPHLLPAAVAKYFADDWGNSRAFREVRYVFDEGDVPPGWLILRGVAQRLWCSNRAPASGGTDRLELKLGLTVGSPGAREVVWEKDLVRRIDGGKKVTIICVEAGTHLQSMSAEALRGVRDVLLTGSRSDDRRRGGVRPGDSVEDILKLIEEE
ncbi:hypothetical protein ACFL2T_06825 [Elusimicrobiota bacterium]